MTDCDVNDNLSFSSYSMISNNRSISGTIKNISSDDNSVIETNEELKDDHNQISNHQLTISEKITKKSKNFTKSTNDQNNCSVTKKSIIDSEMSEIVSNHTDDEWANNENVDGIEDDEENEAIPDNNYSKLYVILIKKFLQNCLTNVKFLLNFNGGKSIIPSNSIVNKNEGNSVILEDAMNCIRIHGTEETFLPLDYQIPQRTSKYVKKSFDYRSIWKQMHLLLYRQPDDDEDDDKNKLEIRSQRKKTIQRNVNSRHWKNRVRLTDEKEIYFIKNYKKFSQFNQISESRNLFYRMDCVGRINPILYPHPITSIKCLINDRNRYRGNIRLQMFVNEKNEKLHILLMRAIDLPQMDIIPFDKHDSIEACDPYVILYLLDIDEYFGRSSIKKETYHPRWYEEFILPLTGNSNESISNRLLKMNGIRLKLFDYDMITADDIIGEVNIKFSDINTFLLFEIMKTKITLSCDIEHEEQRNAVLFFKLTYLKTNSIIVILLQQIKEIDENFEYTIHLRSSHQPHLVWNTSNGNRSQHNSRTIIWNESIKIPITAQELKTNEFKFRVKRENLVIMKKTIKLDGNDPKFESFLTKINDEMISTNEIVSNQLKICLNE